MARIKIVKLKNKKNLKIISSSGIIVIYEYLNRIGFIDSIKKLFEQNIKRDGIYKDYKLFIVYLLALIDGSKRIDDISKWLSKNKNLVNYLGLKTIPKTEIFFNFLKRSGTNDKLLKELKLFNKYDIITKNYLSKIKEDIIVEIDATYMQSSIKEAKYNYKNEKSYSLLLEHVGEERLIYDYEFRDGNINPREGIYEKLNSFLETYRDKKILFVSDSAGYQFKIIKELNAKGQKYVIKMRNSTSLSSSKTLKSFEHGETFSGYMLLDSDYVMQHNNEYEYFRTILINKNELFSSGAICTNIYDKSSKEIFKIYRNRTNEELAIKELKNGFSGSYVPSKYRAINEFFMLLNVYCYNLIKLFQFHLRGADIIIDKKVNYITIERLRLLFIDIASLMVNKARQLYLYLNLSNTHFELFNKIYNFCCGFIV